MKILIVNAGSSSLKYQLVDMDGEKLMAKGLVERIGIEGSKLTQKVNGQEIVFEQPIKDHTEACSLMIKALTDPEKGAVKHMDEIGAVGHRVLHGGEAFTASVLINEEVKEAIRANIPLGPLHNPANLMGIEACEKVMPGTPNVAVFDTAFHQTMPPKAYLYGVPYEWYEKYGVQRLGYHGASHAHVADVLNSERGHYRAISCHLGGSCSICAIEDGKSVDTSFGMSLESGLIHANRVGDLDAGMVYFLRGEGLSDEEIRAGFTKNGGLLGISGVSNDLRYVLEAAEAGNERAELAVGVFVTGIVHYIGAFYLDLGGLDSLVFTAGIGENSAEIRSRVCERLSPLGLRLDEAANTAARGDAVISAPDSAVEVRVIPADEELSIARRAYEL